MIQFRLQKQLYAATGTMQMNISCEIATGKLVSLYGASGAGKTSILRMLAGLMRPDQGEVQFDDELWYDSAKGIDVPVQKRSIGLVFQDYALFPNMTVKQNLQFALRKGEPETLIDELMSITELVQLQKRNVLTLSGGQKQRVALARALVRRPKLLLLDEPLSAIENELREKLQDMLIKLHRRYNLTTILVSHDPGELARLSDQIFFIESGLIKREGSPADIFFEPQNENNYKLAGYIAEIKKEGDACVFYVMIGDQLIKYLPGEGEINVFKKGDRIVLKREMH